MAETIIEAVHNPETMEWFFKNLLKWEAQVFPVGCLNTEDDMDELRLTYRLGQYNVLLAWTRIGTKRHLSGVTTYWHEIDKLDSYINCVFVFPKFRGMGIAPKLIDWALSTIQYGGRQARIWTVEDNHPMHHILGKMKSEGRFQHRTKIRWSLDYYGDGRQLHYIEYRGFVR